MLAVAQSKVSALQKHTKNWIECQRCNLCKDRKSVCLYRGVIPSDLLFIGEAPGESEDLTGYPFTGPAGKRLDKIISQIEDIFDKPFTYSIANVIACIPKDKTGENFVRPPTYDEIEACKPRLKEFVSITEPKGIVLLGDTADQHTRWIDPPAIKIAHPAYIVRQSPNERSLQTKRCALQIISLLERIL